DDHLYCNLGAQCGGEGTCSVQPWAADCKVRSFAPVCGCDGRSYTNDCTALVHGATVAKQQACMQCDFHQVAPRTFAGVAGTWASANGAVTYTIASDGTVTTQWDQCKMPGRCGTTTVKKKTGQAVLDTTHNQLTI